MTPRYRTPGQVPQTPARTLRAGEGRQTIMDETTERLLAETAVCTCLVAWECVVHGAGCNGACEDCCIGRTAESAPFPVGIVPGFHLPRCPALGMSIP